jgi:hemerythrin-like domain-containing protein
MGAATKMARAKLSTTVASETYEFLEQMVERGQAATLAEALDTSISKVRRLENRRRLADATARYFEQLEPHIMAEENALTKDMMSAASTIDFDQEI